MVCSPPGRSLEGRSLESLPLEVLERICDYLPGCDARRRSLFCFSLASRRCCSAATRQRFAHMSITTRTKERLQADVAKWSAMLSLRQGLGYVRRVTIIGYNPLFPDDAYNNAQELEEERCGLEGELQLDAYSGWGNPSDRFFSPPDEPLMMSMGSYDSEANDDRDKQDDLWRSFVQLLKSLHRLEDFIFVSGEQLPRNILATLHEHHPQSRLHMLDFDLKSLRYTRESPRQLHPDELALATSPCLYSVVTKHSGFCEDEYDYNNDAVEAMMAHAAPNLKHVWLKYEQHGASLAYQRAALSGPRPAWPGFPSSVRSDSIGRPRTLVLDGASFQIKKLFSGGCATDFSCLTNLDIMCYVPDSTLQHLVDMATLGKFKSLRSLGLPLREKPRDGDQDDTSQDEAMDKLLAALGPLSSVTVYNTFREEPLQAILTRHGPSLRCLRIDTSEPVSLVQLDKIQQHCPDLRELQLSILRTQGDEQEVALYRSFGRFSRLERLTLWMQLAPDSEFASTKHHFGLNRDNEGCAKRIRNLLANAAIDAALGRSIFRLVSTAQGSEEMLQYLRVQPRDPSRIPSYGDNSELQILSMVLWIARSWICERGDWDNTGEDVSVREVVRSQRQFYDKILDEVAAQAGPSDQAWRQLWPDRTGDWKESWKSVPLSELSE